MDTRKKVLLCVTKSAAGGAQKYVCDLATRLPADQFETVVIAGDSGSLFGMVRKKGIRAISVSGLGRDIRPLYELRAFFDLIRIFMREKPHIIHLNSSKMGAMGGVAARIAKLLTLNRKLRIIFTVHGWGFREDRSMAARATIFGVSWVASRFHDHTIVINSADHADARAFIPHKNISLIPLGTSAPLFVSRESSRAFFKKQSGFPIDDNAFVIGVTAELVKNKGLSYLIDAFGLLSVSDTQSRIYCVIMGEGEDRKQLADRINTFELEGHISLLGFVADAYRYLPGIDLFVLPSVKEGLPYALMEAMHAGLPVIASRVGGIPDLISHNQNGLLIPPKNHEALSRHIGDLFASRKRRELLGARARDTVLSRFSFDRMIAKTACLYTRPTA